MARFYGTVQGNKGVASRLGHAVGGLRVEARTWTQSFRVELWANDANVGKKNEEKTDYGYVSLGGFKLFSGPVEQFTSKEGIAAWLVSHLRRDNDVARIVMEQFANEALEEHASS